MQKIIFLSVFVIVWHYGCGESDQVNLDYCIVGAGPSGLQMAQLLSKADRNYMVFESSNSSGNFYVKYPRHGKLISINKRHTGQTNDEFNLRHDWNSLLSDDLSLRMTKYTKQFFPPNELLVKYLNDFKKELNLNVQYETQIVNVNSPTSDQKEQSFILTDQNDQNYKCRTVVMATGLATEHIIPFEGHHLAKTYSQVSTNPDDFEGKSVLILGRGNSAFEVADSIMGSTNLIHMLSRSRVKLSWETHYVGDLRAVNNGLLDTYQLKSLDAVLEAEVEEMKLYKKDGKIKLSFSDDEQDFDNFALRESYDEVISCLGFKYDFTVFNQSTPHPKPHVISKYPAILPNYESQHVPGLFFAGTSTHSLDFRKSAGGFIHGFRYTTRALHHLLEWQNHGIKWPGTTVPWSDLMNTVLKRINEASGTYQMFQVLGDVILINDAAREITYLQEFPIKLIADLQSYTGHSAQRAIIVVFEYGKNFSGPGNDIFRTSRATGEPSEAHLSNFLHPVFYYYERLPNDAEMLDIPPRDTLPRPTRIHHIVEDFLTDWNGQYSHLLPLRRFLETSVGTDLRTHTANECFEIAMTHINMPVECEQRYLSGKSLTIPEHWADPSMD